MSTKLSEDITATIGPLFSPEEPRDVQMYSYERPAFLFWQGVYDALRADGMSKKKALEWLQSKNARWLLDHDGTALLDLGRSLAASYLHPRRTADSLDEPPDNFTPTLIGTTDEF